MDKPSKLPIRAARPAFVMDRVSQLREDWRLARGAHRDLALMGMPRVNLFLVGRDGVIENMLELLGPDLVGPVVTWRSGERLVLPPQRSARTLILRGVGDLSRDDQERLSALLEADASIRPRIISTTASSLVPRIEVGAFSESLFYRLNTVCLDLTN